MLETPVYSISGSGVGGLGLGFELRASERRDLNSRPTAPVKIGQHYLSNATCLMRPRSVHACFVVSRITIICCGIRHF